MQHNRPLTMIRVNLSMIPQHPLLSGYTLRWYRPGDERAWLAIHLAADRYNNITPELYRREFGSDIRKLAERQCFLVNAKGAPIGTATAWDDDNFQGRRYGRVHWVALMPEVQGRGLAKPLMTAICQRLRELGHDRAYLVTSTARLPAINLYLKFGFLPQLNSYDEERDWQEIVRCLRASRSS